MVETKKAGEQKTKAEPIQVHPAGEKTAGAAEAQTSSRTPSKRKPGAKKPVKGKAGARKAPARTPGKAPGRSSAAAAGRKRPSAGRSDAGSGREKNIRMLEHKLRAGLPENELALLEGKSFQGLVVELYEHLLTLKGKKEKILLDVIENKLSEGELHTVAVLAPKRSFQFESLTIAMIEAGVRVTRYLEAIVPDPTSQAGKELEIVYFESESFVHPATARLLQTALKQRLKDIEIVTRDHERMVEKLTLASREITTGQRGPSPQNAEAAEFLHYLIHENFAFCGHRFIELTGGGSRKSIAWEEGLGLCRHKDFVVFDALHVGGPVPDFMDEFLHQDVVLRVSKANRVSGIFRPVHFDVLWLKRYDGKRIVGLDLFVGLFSRQLYLETLERIPILRQKLEALVHMIAENKLDVSLRHIRVALGHYPRDDLFQIEIPLLYEHTLSLLSIRQRNIVKLLLRRDKFERFISAYVFLPRENCNEAMLTHAREILGEAFQGASTAEHSFTSDDPLGRLQLIFRTTPGKIPNFDITVLEQRLQQATLDWSESLLVHLVHELGEQEGQRLYQNFVSAFSGSYRERAGRTPAGLQLVLQDILLAEASLRDSQGYAFSFRKQPDQTGLANATIRIYSCRGQTVMSDVVPMLESMGLRVISEVSTDITPAYVTPGTPGTSGEKAEKKSVNLTVWYVHIEALQTYSDTAFERMTTDALILIRLMLTRHNPVDALNQLVVRAGLDARKVHLFRSFGRYLQQCVSGLRLPTLAKSLGEFADITRQMSKLFDVYFDPDYRLKSGGALSTEQRKKAGAPLRKNILESINALKNLSDDRIFRCLLEILDNTLRVNYFQTGEDGRPKDWISFKLDVQGLSFTPQPRPMREIFVSAPDFEGTHLRFGLVARGGLRWSDRPDDYRTEILGLVKAQQVKNAVIVPVGAKGGFILKEPPPMRTRAEMNAYGLARYKKFVRALLELTDNRPQPQGGQAVSPAAALVAPPRTVCYDPVDPYLVVAADKGTASFSDHANQIAIEKNFWLGDAFASGGSAGYDHKKMGITARGGWESVKRHFRELELDTQTTNFDVVGVGDMAGDVFGNAMRLSRHIRLLAAFNHLHIFVDPTPDTAVQYKERERLFQEQAGWGSYNKLLLSPGGAVFDRSDKKLVLSQQIMTRFEIGSSEVTPTQLMQAILKAKVDMIWFGGIGTYIKSNAESHGAVNDHANDDIRVNASEVRARVLGEGANLGLTQKGRVQLAQLGKKLNTDAIDNSAGVDCSDHEVNIKILLELIVRNKKMSLPERNKCLFQMTEQVSALVLKNNYQQNQALSVTESRAPELLDFHVGQIREFEQLGLLDRALEYLPDEDEVYQRRQAHQGLTRPELAVLLAYGKNITYDLLYRSTLPDEKVFEHFLHDYFPEKIRTSYAAYIGQHPLRREIISSRLCNYLLNRTGPGFFIQLSRRTGVSIPQVMLACYAVMAIFEIEKIWKQIEGLEHHVTSPRQYRMFYETQRTVDRMVPWLIANESFHAGSANRTPQLVAVVRKYTEGKAKIEQAFQDIASGTQVALRENRALFFETKNVPKGLAFQLGSLKFLSTTCEIVRLAEKTQRPVLEVGRVYLSLSDHFRLDDLRTKLGSLASDSSWVLTAVESMIEELWTLQAELTRHVFKISSKKTAGRKLELKMDPMAHFLKTVAEPLSRIEQMLDSFERQGTIELAMMIVFVRDLRKLLLTN